MDDGNRATVQVSLDKRIVDEAEAAGLNAAQVAEELLRRHLREVRRAAMTDDEREALRQQINQDIAWRNAMIDESGLFGQDWRTF
jgi:post-segregation antitoxin (ccd killing protein)